MRSLKTSQEKVRGRIQALAHEIPTLLEHGQYRIESFTDLQYLAQGACGIVLKGHDPWLDISVAIKVQTNPEDMSDTHKGLSMTMGEARLLARIKSPHVLQVHRLTQDSLGNSVMVMEFVPGGRDLNKYRQDLKRSNQKLKFTLYNIYSTQDELLNRNGLKFLEEYYGLDFVSNLILEEKKEGIDYEFENKSEVLNWLKKSCELLN